MADVPLTLMDMLKANMIGTELSSMVMNMGKSSDLLQRLRFVPTPSGRAYWNMYDELEDPTYRALNADVDATKNTSEPVSEQTVVLSDKILFDDVNDKRNAARGGGSDHDLSRQFNLKGKAFQRKFSKDFFDGDNGANPKAFDGLNVRLTNTSGYDQNLLNAEGSILSESMLDDLQDLGNGVGPNHAFCGGKVEMRQFKKLLQKNDQITYGPDMFGRRVPYYNGIPLLNMGYDNDNSEILAADETESVSGRTDTYSIYLIDFGTDEGVVGLQDSPIKTYPPHQEGPIISINMDWACGIALLIPTAARRLKGLVADNA